jgi:hypothetical protein
MAVQRFAVVSRNSLKLLVRRFLRWSLRRLRRLSLTYWKRRRGGAAVVAAVFPPYPQGHAAPAWGGAAAPVRRTRRRELHQTGPALGGIEQ